MKLQTFSKIMQLSYRLIFFSSHLESKILQLLLQDQLSEQSFPRLLFVNLQLSLLDSYEKLQQ